MGCFRDSVPNDHFLFMNLPDLPSSLLCMLLLPALLHVVAGLLVRQVPQLAAWNLGALSSKLGLGVAVIALLTYGVVRVLDANLAWLNTSWTLLGLGTWLRFDAIGLLMLGLVNFLGVIILKFSRQYLAGDTGQRRFQQSFHATLASVSLLVISNHLLVISFMWLSTSLWVHRLLNFYPNRPQAVLAAHKKFLLSRIADGSFLIAVLLIYGQTGTFRLDVLAQSMHELQGALPVALTLASLAVVFAVIIKCAQLPFHGWLIQVMEAPTPVSALLHAGVVNLGGFLLLRLSFLIAASEWAQLLLILTGAVTAILAGMIMMTQSSVKLSLAWSTCAQMGFMLLECGVGAYALALLHLMAHSLYKAHAFLSSGRTVSRVQVAARCPLQLRRSVVASMLAPLVVASVVWGSMQVWGIDLGNEPHFILAALIMTLGTSILLRDAWASQGWSALTRAMWQIPMVVTLYFAWHAGFVALSSTEVPHHSPLSGSLLMLGVGFALQYGLQSWVVLSPHSQKWSVLYAWFSAGLYLDEWFTRMTFRWWPPQTLPTTACQQQRVHGELELVEA